MNSSPEPTSAARLSSSSLRSEEMECSEVKLKWLSVGEVMEDAIVEVEKWERGRSATEKAGRRRRGGGRSSSSGSWGSGFCISFAVLADRRRAGGERRPEGGGASGVMHFSENDMRLS